MLILVSPAKTLDYESELKVKEFSIASHLSDSNLLVKELQKRSPEDLASLMGLSEKLSPLNFEFDMNWAKPTKLSESARQAIFAFKGDVYQGLEASSLSRSEIKYAQKNLCILSGLYGMLKPLDLMYPYRLEMGTKMKNKRGDNLYEFWGSKVTNSLNKLGIENRSKAVVNLASVEYFSSINKNNLSGQVISPIFKDYKNGEYKIISFFAKKARGMMARFIIDNKIDDPKDLKSFDVSKYKYNKKESTDLFPVFFRKNLNR